MDADSLPAIIKGEPYFEDGNVVLLGHEDDLSLAFKVHRGILARHSEVFQSMFEIPQSDDFEHFQGSQLVRMYDNATELSNLLKALYDGATFGNHSVEDFFYLAGVLRLSSKYFIKHLRTQAIQHLTLTWPYTLEGHDTMIHLALNSPLQNNTTYPYVHPLHALNLAREIDAQIVVPSVLYFLSIYNLAEILREDHPKLISVNHPSRPSSQLSEADIKGYTLMYQSRVESISDFLGFFRSMTRPPNCLDIQNQCSQAHLKVTARLSRSWVFRTGPFHFMLQAREQLIEERFCGLCRAAFLQEIATYRENAWCQLPSVVGLPSWEQLQATDLQGS